jgi:hypothetical protein
MTSASKQMRPNKHDPRSDRSQLKSAPPSQDGQCPRCACVLVDRGGEEPACPVCGYADYSHVPEPSTRPLVPGKVGRPEKRWETANHIGDHPLKVRFLFGEEYIRRYVVTCPWCETRMSRVPHMAGQYRCRKQHRVTLSETASGEVVWE